MRTRTKKTLTSKRRHLAKGQVWKTKDAHVQIVQLGNILVHYKLLKTPGRQMTRTQMSRIDSMEEYLRTNKARLIDGISRN